MKKILSLFLAFIMIVPMVISVSAKEKIIPRLSIRGFMSNPIYDGDGKQLWPLDTNNLLKNIVVLAPEAVKLKVTHNWDKFGDAVVKSVNNIFGDLRCDRTEILKIKAVLCLNIQQRKK